MRLRANFAWLAVAEAASKALTFVAVAYLARVVGPERFGYVEFGLSVMLVAGLIVDQGFGPYGAREIAKAPQRAVALAQEIVAARIVLALLAFLGMALLALAIGFASPAASLLLLYGLGLFAMPFLAQWVFQGHDMMRPIAALQLLRQAVYALIVIAFVRRPEQFWLAALAETVAALVAAVAGAFYCRRALGVRISPFGAKSADGRPAPRFRFSRQLLTEGVTIGLSQMFWTLRMFGATALLATVAPPADLGIFGAAMRLLIAAHTFVWLYYFNLLPSLSRSWTRADGSFHALIARSTRLVGVLGLVIALVWVLLARPAVVLIYGPEFAPAGDTLRILAAVWLLALLSGHYRFGLIAAGRQRAEMICSFVGACVAVAGIPLGYSLAGAQGAAVGLVLAEAAVWLAARYFALRYTARAAVSLA